MKSGDFSKNQDAAEQYTKTLHMRSFPRETALKYIQSFKLVWEIGQSCTVDNHDITIDKLNQLIDALEGTEARHSLIEREKVISRRYRNWGDTERFFNEGATLVPEYRRRLVE